MRTGRQRAGKMAVPIRMISWLLSMAPKAFRYFVLNNFNGSNILSVGMRYCALRSLARNCGENVYIGRYTTFKNLHNLDIGSNVSFHEYCYLDASGGISIGSNVSIATGSTLLSFEHSWDDLDHPIKYNPVRLVPLTIEDDVWISCRCAILGGSYISRRTVVAAGAVVKGHLDSGYVFAGVPAKPKRAILGGAGRSEDAHSSPVP